MTPSSISGFVHEMVAYSVLPGRREGDVEKFSLSLAISGLKRKTVFFHSLPDYGGDLPATGPCFSVGLAIPRLHENYVIRFLGRGFRLSKWRKDILAHRRTGALAVEMVEGPAGGVNFKLGRFRCTKVILCTRSSIRSSERLANVALCQSCFCLCGEMPN